MATRILVVEDNAAMRELIREYLAQDDQLQIVGEAISGAEAVHLAKQENPDIVLMDLVLADAAMNGLEATKIIKEASPSTEVIVLSSRATPEMKTLHRENPRDYPATIALNKSEIGTHLLRWIHILMENKGDND